jgi:DNA-binding transcriptional LysR family regulator
MNTRERSHLPNETEYPVELTDLLTFSTVARLGGITRAADELNTVQSNVTQRVKALEAEIGTALFERHSRGMTLTGAGRRLLPYAQRMAALSREAMLAARDDGEPKGPLSIGSMETTAAVRLPTLLAEFHRHFPAVRLTLRTAPTADLVAAVLDGALDGAFVAGPIEHAELSSTSAFREELVLVTARKWSSLASLRAGTPESGPTALVFRTGCTYRQRLEQVFSEFGWPSAARFELGTLDGMIGCVAADMGVTLLPRAVVERDHVNRDISIHPLAASQSRVDTLFIQRRSAHQYSALQGFVACLTKREEVAAA